MHGTQAVKTAKEYLAEIFEGESISDIKLEEVIFDEVKDVWKITLSFLRPGLIPDLFPTTIRSDKNRSYKVVHVSNESEEAGSVVDRILRPPEY